MDMDEEEVIPYGRFDPFNAWELTVNSSESSESREATVRETVSPLMSSMKCFVGNSEIEGRDILDTDLILNPLFHDYNHVLIPYCSSDLWLGEETTPTRAVNEASYSSEETNSTSAVMDNDTNCDCFNYTTKYNDGCFNFHEADDLLFTFRGKTIYQSIMKQLKDGSDDDNIKFNLGNADKVILAGSSAGGVGVVNHAKWTRGVLNSNTTLSVLLDSSWFIDYLDGIENVFKFSTSTDSIDTESTHRDRMKLATTQIGLDTLAVSQLTVC